MTWNTLPLKLTSDVPMSAITRLHQCNASTSVHAYDGYWVVRYGMLLSTKPAPVCYTLVFVHHMHPGQRCAPWATTAPMELLRPRSGAQLARLGRFPEWSTSLAVGNANRATSACPGRLEFFLNPTTSIRWPVHGWNGLCSIGVQRPPHCATS